MMKKYLAVGFINDKGQPVEVIPSNWLANDDACFWPNETDPNKLSAMIRKCIPPKETWLQHPIKIYGKSNSFNVAGEKVKQARVLSSIGSDSSDDDDIQSQKRLTKLPIRYRESFVPHADEESDDLLENLEQNRKVSENKKITLPKPPSDPDEDLPHVCRALINETTMLETVKESQQCQRTATQAQPGSFTNFLEAPSVQEETILEKVLKHLTEIKNEMKVLKKENKKLRERVETLLQIKENPKVVAAIGDISEVENFENLPLKNLAELQSLEIEITRDSSKATSLARFLCKGGGFTNTNSLIRVIIKRLLSRNVALEYSLEGRQQKKKFADLNLLNVVIASVKMKFEETETSAICSHVGKMLAGAIDWDGNRMKRKRSEMAENEC